MALLLNVARDVFVPPGIYKWEGLKIAPIKQTSVQTNNAWKSEKRGQFRRKTNIPGERMTTCRHREFSVDLTGTVVPLWKTVKTLGDFDQYSRIPIPHEKPLQINFNHIRSALRSRALMQQYHSFHFRNIEKCVITVMHSNLYNKPCELDAVNNNNNNNNNNNDYF